MAFLQALPTVFHHLTPEHGLSQAVNSFVHKDSRGFVWISSLDGLNRYDGHRVRVYRPNPGKPNALRGNLMQSRFYETPEGDLWFCTWEAINCYRRKTDDFESLQLRDKSGNIYTEGYYIFHRDASGKLWLRLNGQLLRFDPRTRRTEFLGPLDGVRCFADTHASGQVRGIYSCYFSSRAGIRYTRLNNAGKPLDSDTFFGENDRAKRPSLFVSDMYLENDTLVWLCGPAGLTAFNPRQRSYRQYAPTTTVQAGLRAVAPLNDRLLAVSSTTSGLWVFDKIARRFVRQATPDPDNPRALAALRCEELNTDADGNLWVSHWNTGLSFANLHKQKFRQIPATAALPHIAGSSIHLSGITEDAQGRIWCSTEGAGIFLLYPDGSPAADFSRRSDLPHRYFTHLAKDRSNTIWAVERQHLYRYNPAADRFVEIPKTGDLPEMLFAFETTGGRLLIGTYRGVYEAITSPAGTHSIVPAKGFEFLKNDMVDWMYEDSSGNFYLGKKASTLLVSGPKGRREFPFGYIKAAYEAGRTIWLATTTGLVQMDKADFSYKLYDESTGLPNQYLYSVIPDKSGFLWLASNKGILRFDPRTGAARQYSAADGVWANEFYSNIWLRHSSGSVWLGNRDMLNVFRPEYIRDMAVLPGVQITGLKVNDLDRQDSLYIGERSSLEFPYTDNTLSFDFVALDYSDPSGTRLRYRLNGYDDNWVEVPPGLPGFARYANLPPGHYTLQIMAANSDGVWNPAPRQLRLHILPPFWQTWWFVLTTLTALVAGAYALYRLRVARLRREFDFRQKTAESEMRALRAQMNPHFIFNSLNSINAYILRNEGKTANAYLTGFAQLMRQILDNSARETIPLETEIEFLQSYLRAESLRLENKMTWDIRVADNVDTFETEIPSMILQPYIENAVWHGIAHKPEGGTITVAIGRDASGALLCTVEDNGVGRARARELRPLSGRPHESKGLRITEERLALYDQKHGTRSTVVTTDLLDDKGHAAGTRVEVRIADLG